ncbi:MAG: hypothetical protein JXC33_05030, partial [Deltaproteobacteria bacterium]|nr:hypothetical protein [Deltaproteobacteria bacterium]
MKKAVFEIYFCVLTMSLCLMVTGCQTGHKPIPVQKSKQTTKATSTKVTSAKATSAKATSAKATSTAQLTETKIFGWLVGISGRDGKFDPAVVAKKCAELKGLAQPSSKQQYIDQCRKMGGIPQDGTGKIFRLGRIPQMGGVNCIICWSKKDLNDPNVRRLVEPACPEADT